MQQEAPQQAAPFGAAPAAHPTMPATPGASTVAPTFNPQPVPFQPQAAQPFTGPVPGAGPTYTQGGPAPGQMPDMPAFLQRQQPATAAPQQGAPAFGMSNGATPDPALSQALTQAFGQPMQPRTR